MNKIKDLSKKIKKSLTSKVWTFSILSKLDRIIRNLLQQGQDTYLQKRTLNKLAALNLDPATNESVKILVLNCLRNIIHTNFTSLQIQSYESLERQVDLALEVCVSIVKNIRPLFGFQPMAGPVGLAYQLRYKDRTKTVDDSSSLENIPKANLVLEVVSHAVQAKTRQFETNIPIEPQMDIQALHGDGGLDEVLNAIAYEVTYETLSAIFNEILTKSKTTEIELDMSKNGVDKFWVEVNMLSNEIASSTLRGAGNFVVMGPVISSLLKLNSGFVPKSKDKDRNAFIKHLGSISSGLIDVYENLYFTDEIIIGYKGKGGGDTDTGLIYTPFIPVSESGITIDPISFAPIKKLNCRYDQIFDPKYYRVLKIKQ